MYVHSETIKNSDSSCETSKKGFKNNLYQKRKTRPNWWSKNMRCFKNTMNLREMNNNHLIDGNYRKLAKRIVRLKLTNYRFNWTNSKQSTIMCMQNLYFLRANFLTKSRKRQSNIILISMNNHGKQIGFLRKTESCDEWILL